MILKLSDRCSPLDGPAARWRRGCRLLFSLGLVLIGSAALGIAWRDWTAAPQPTRSPSSAPVIESEPGAGARSPWGPDITRFQARRPTDVLEEPGLSKLVTRLFPGETATVIRREENWLLVETELGPGWIDTAPRPWRPRVIPTHLVQPPSESAPAEPSPLEPQRPAEPEPTPLPEPLRRALEIEGRRDDSPAIAWARSQLSQGGLRKLESENFRLWTDLEDSRQLGLLLGLAEQTRRRFRAVFEPYFDVQDLTGRSEVYLFRRRADYLHFYDSFGRAGSANPSGHYSMDLRMVALSAQSASGNALAATVVHEMAHLLLDQSLYRGTRPPRDWIGEGLACSFAFSAGSEDGKIAGIESKLDPLGVGPPALARVQAIQRDWKNRTALPVSDLLDAGSGGFTGQSSSRYYDAAWLLCHFLLYGDQGRHRDVLIDAMIADRNDLPLDAANQRVRQLEMQFRRYVMGLGRR